jgi:hypothetical protein
VDEDLIKEAVSVRTRSSTYTVPRRKVLSALIGLLAVTLGGGASAACGTEDRAMPPDRGASANWQHSVITTQHVEDPSPEAEETFELASEILDSHEDI